MSNDGGVRIQIFKQKFQNREENISHIAWQSWYFQMKFSWKKQAALKKNLLFLFFFLAPYLTAIVETEAHFVVFSEKSLMVADTFK